MKNQAKPLALLATTFFLMSFCGCAKKPEEDKPPVSLAVEPLVGIGDVKFGDSSDVITAAFGKPDKIQAQGKELNSERVASFQTNIRSRHSRRSVPIERPMCAAALGAP